MLGFDVMAFFSRGLQSHDDNPRTSSRHPRDSYYFFARHASAWNRHLTWDLYNIRIEHWFVQMNLCVRSFAADLPTPRTTANRVSEFQCKRESGTLSLCGTTLSFTARRYSLAVSARINTQEWPKPIYPFGVCMIIEVCDPHPSAPPPDHGDGPLQGHLRKGTSPTSNVPTTIQV